MTASRARPKRPIEIAGHSVQAGSRQRIDMPVALLPTHTQLHIPMTVVHGSRPGPCIWVSAAVHGDELNGVEIIRQVLERVDEKRVAGTILAVPIVNVFGFIGQSRYLPDRRDLNRSFPGSKRGSLASRIAHLFMQEVVDRCQWGIDLHTGSNDRSNLAQVRGDMYDHMTLKMARAFAPPAIVQSVIRDGSLRAAATKRGAKVLLFEGGEAQRFDREVIDIGVRGVMRVLRSVGVLAGELPKLRSRTVFVPSSKWLRARRGGLLRLDVRDGDFVEVGQELGVISDPFDEVRVALKAPNTGIVLGKTNNPVVHGGDGIVHLGEIADGPSESGEAEAD